MAGSVAPPGKRIRLGESSGNELEHLRRHAAAEVLADLVDMVIAENLFGVRTRARVHTHEGCLPLAEGEQYVEIPFDVPVDRPIEGGREGLAFRARPGGALQPYRLSRPPVLLVDLAGQAAPAASAVPTNKEPTGLSARELLDLLVIGCASASCPPENLDEVLDGLELAVTQGAQALTRVIDLQRALATAHPSLLVWERLASLSDRPFHPTARAKQGWDDTDHLHYGAAFGNVFGLDWVAVRRDHLVCGRTQPEDARQPAEVLLSRAGQQALTAAAEAAKASESGDYLILPVHPWQRRHVLPALYAEELRSRACVPVTANLGSFAATSSVRSLAVSSSCHVHVKLPLGIVSLGALRLLPPRYLQNGQRAQRLLEQAADRHPALATRLRWCDEQQWWAFSDPERDDTFDDKPGHLGCLVRGYPADLLGPRAGTGHPRSLVPMSALAVVTPEGAAPGIARLVAERHPGEQADQAAALDLYGEICRALTDVALACWTQGFMPELHGQNVLVAMDSGAVESVVLRDHDTLRIYPPWLKDAGLADPGYVVKPDVARELVTLIAATPEALLSWYQTLGVQVNLYAIGTALVKAYGADEREVWHEVADAIHAALDRLDLSAATAAMARRQLLDADTWPTKLVLRPLLARRKASGGMPSGIGATDNPLRLRTRAPHAATRARNLAEAAARERLLNTYVRESGLVLSPCDVELPGEGQSQAQGVPFVVVFPRTAQRLYGSAISLSPTGHHRYGRDFWTGPARASDDDNARRVNGAALRPLVGAHDLVQLVAGELAAAEQDPTQRRARHQALVSHLDNSVAKSTLYLERRLMASADDTATRPLEAPCPFLAAEQGLLLGHPFHPTPKASEGFDADDVSCYAPELHASFPLHWLAASPELVDEDRLVEDQPLPIPPDVAHAAAARLGDRRRRWPLLACHPWQAGYLSRQPRVRTLVEAGKLVLLGALGAPVHPTSSVRTVWLPSLRRFFKLALEVRITNFVRVNPPDQLRRSIDASRVLAAVAGGSSGIWTGRSPGLTVLLEHGYRTLVVPGCPQPERDALMASFGVLYREAPALTDTPPLMVVAALLEACPSDGVPPLVRAIETASQARTDSNDNGPSPELVCRWLRRYLEIFLVPQVRLLVEKGVSLEAHPQNALVALEDGWPVRCVIRDLEGASINRHHKLAADLYGGLLDADSPALYPEVETWQRLAYNAVVNHVGQLIATLAFHLGPSEPTLWSVARQTLVATGASVSYLLDRPTLPAKANLRSRFQQRSEQPLYVEIPNPLRAFLRRR